MFHYNLGQLCKCSVGELCSQITISAFMKQVIGRQAGRQTGRQERRKSKFLLISNSYKGYKNTYLVTIAYVLSF